MIFGKIFKFLVLPGTQNTIPGSSTSNIIKMCTARQINLVVNLVPIMKLFVPVIHDVYHRDETL